MTLTVHDVEQRSPEWLQLRAGIVTASTVGQLLTPTLRVADNDTSRALTLSLVAERITGHIEEGGYVSNDMLRGQYEEPRAIDIYADITGQEVKTCGFMRWDDPAGWALGYSPDGLVGEDGLIEVKSPRQKGHLSTVLADQAPARHMAQMQAGMLVSGRSWCDYVSFCGGMAPDVKRVEADPDWFAAITAAVAAFEKNAAAMTADYHARTQGLPVPERIDYFEDLGLEF